VGNLAAADEGEATCTGGIRPQDFVLEELFEAKVRLSVKKG
jgi:hypothetical protein